MKTGTNGLYFEAEKTLDHYLAMNRDTVEDIEGRSKAYYVNTVRIHCVKRDGTQIKLSTARRYVREYVRRHGTLTTKLRALYVRATSNLPFFN